MLPSINIRRRKSNLGRRSHAGERPPFPAAVFAVPSATSALGRIRSAKKTPLAKASKDYLARKRLFLNRSPNDVFLNVSSKGLSQASPSFSVDSSNSSLNVTGIRRINTPSPDVKRLLQSDSSNSIMMKGEECSSTVRKLDLFSVPKVKEQRNPTVNPYMYDCSKPPQSPGPSKYDAIIRKELDSLKPPEDPGDNVHMKKFLESLTLKSSSIEKCSKDKYIEPQIPTTCCSSTSAISSNMDRKSTVEQKKEELSSVSVDKLSVIQEDETNEDNSFILAEQTILGNQSLKGSKDTWKKNEPNKLESSASTQKDDEMLEAVVALDADIANMEQILKNMKALRIKLLQVNRKQQPENGRTVKNKENIPANVEMKWFASLKTGNPGLLKTPTIAKRNSVKNNQMNQSAILTPHSLSMALNNQMEDLYSDEYY